MSENHQPTAQITQVLVTDREKSQVSFSLSVTVTTLKESIELISLTYTMAKTRRVIYLTDSDEIQRSSEGDTNQPQLGGVVVSVPDQQFRVRWDCLHGAVVDVSAGLECTHVLTVQAASTVDVAEPVGPAGVATVDPVCDMTTLVDLCTVQCSQQ